MGKKPAVFLDRDGVITVERGFICQIGEVETFPYASECVRKIHDKGYWAIVITNQSGVARGIFTEEQLVKLHEKIKEESGVDAIYYCPHYVQGKIKKYSVECACRKPGTKLIDNACKDFDIDMKNSYMVGDRAGDVITGINAGIKTVLLQSGYGSMFLEEDVQADFILNDLRDFADII